MTLPPAPTTPPLPLKAPEVPELVLPPVLLPLLAPPVSPISPVVVVVVVVSPVVVVLPDRWCRRCCQWCSSRW